MHFRVSVFRLSIQKLDKIYFRHLLCQDAERIFASAIRLLTLCVFLQQSAILLCENELDKEFRELEQQNQNRYSG